MRLRLLLLLLTLSSQAIASSPRVRAAGSTTVGPVVSEAADHFRSIKKWQITVDTQGGSSGGLSSVADGLAEIGMISKDITDSDRAKYPNTKFVATQVGADAVAIIVSEDLYQNGIRVLDLKQLRSIYEGKVSNWKEVGGPDRKIVFYNKEPGRGTWEVFVKTLYGDAKKAPSVNHPEVGSNQETRSKVGGHKSAVSQLSFSWVDRKSRVRALGIKMDSGEVVHPSPQSITDGSYPLSRNLYVITNGPPTGHVKEFIEHLSSASGEVHVRKHGFISLSELGLATPTRVR